MIVVVGLAADVHFFTPKILNYLKQRKFPHIFVTTVDDLEMVQVIDKVILTGSDLYVSNVQQNPRVDALLKHVIQLPMHVPRIGICFGSQYLYVHAGGKLECLPRAICSTRNIQSTLGVSNVQFCLHEVFVEPLPKLLLPLAWARLGNKTRPCAFKYIDRPWYGFLFHPEAGKASWKIFDAVFKKIDSHMKKVR